MLVGGVQLGLTTAVCLLVYLAGTMHSSLAVPEVAISKCSSVVPGQETEDNISVKRET